VTTSPVWSAFQDEILGIAATFAELKKCEGDHRPPHEVVRDLYAIDKTLTVALQQLMELGLEHHEGQDISAEPFNWPVVQSLGQARSVLRGLDNKSLSEISAYPTELIVSLRELRDAARKAIELEKPGRGNSAGRNPTSARRADLAKNFVFRYRSRFGQMPPMSKTGDVVELLQKMLNAAGEGDDADAGALLRQAIEKDEAGRALLPKAPAVRPAKRAK
jgi:hypothetical protein